MCTKIWVENILYCQCLGQGLLLSVKSQKIYTTIQSSGFRSAQLALHIIDIITGNANAIAISAIQKSDTRKPSPSILSEEPNVNERAMVGGGPICWTGTHEAFSCWLVPGTIYSAGSNLRDLAVDASVGSLSVDSRVTKAEPFNARMPIVLMKGGLRLLLISEGGRCSISGAFQIINSGGIWVRFSFCSNRGNCNKCILLVKTPLSQWL